MNRKNLIVAVFCCLAALPASGRGKQIDGNARSVLELNGVWSTPMGDCILPGTTDMSRLGPGTADTTDTSKLTRLWPYEGRCRYTKDVRIPSRLAGKPLLLYMERTKPSTLYVDGRSCGHFTHIYAPHKYLIGPLEKGVHRFEIEIDNTLEEVPACLPSGHAYSDNTQTNWNGILGRFCIEALPSVYIDEVQVVPDALSGKAEVLCKVVSCEDCTLTLKARAKAFNTKERRTAVKHSEIAEIHKGGQTLAFSMELGEDALKWSEFHPALYSLEVKAGRDKVWTHFGMRDLRAEGNRLLLNGNRIFLRGKHDALVFPLTGCPPTDVKSWREVFRKAKEYGINHYRFHSCAPPKAAFDAADLEGILIQAELPMWGSIKPEEKSLNEFMKREGHMLLDFAGNCPSFAFLGLGNELWGDVDEMSRWIEEFKAHDARRLYDFGANGYLGWYGQPEGQDVLITCRTSTPEGGFVPMRSSFSYFDEPDGGIINAERPKTDRDFELGAATAKMPVIGHETGQFQFYPDFRQIGKYKGVLYPYNLETFRRRLEEKGMGDQAEAFAEASGAFSMECYKEDIEYFLRTPSMSGFEMLDLQDYPGQGTALVGILDAFMDSKGNVSPETFRGYCSELVPMARFEAFCINAERPLDLTLMIANYTEGEWNRELEWKLEDEGGAWSRSGSASARVPQGGLAAVEAVSVSLDGLRAPSCLTLTLSTGQHSNYYHIWAYPSSSEPVVPEGSFVECRDLPSAISALENGSSVLLMPSSDSILEASTGGLFSPDYWNYSMFKKLSEDYSKPVSPGTLGLLLDPSHPLFAEFPTSFHSDWQWWSVTRNSRPLILDGLADYKPLIQVIDNMERCHRLGILSEFKVGNGRLMLCSCDLDSVSEYIEGRQFVKSLKSYLSSTDFNPQYELSQDRLISLLGAKSASQWQASKVDTAADYTVTY